MRISDWSSDVCSSDLAFTVDSLKQVVEIDGVSKPLSEFLLSGDIKPKQLTIVREILYDENANADVDTAIFAGNMSWYEITHVGDRKIGRASCRESVCQYVKISVVAV